MLKKLVAAFLLITAVACGQSYLTRQWGLDRKITPYNFSAKLGGTWRNLDTVNSVGAWNIPVSNIDRATNPLFSSVNTWSASQNFNGDYLSNDPSTIAGQYRSPIVSTAAVAASVSDNITAGLFTLQNLRNYDPINPYRGLNSTIYVQGIKYGTSATWGATIEARDHTGTGDPSQALQGIEVDMVANGSDVNKVRSAIPIVLYRYNRPPAIGAADIVVGSAISLATWSGDQNHSKFTDGFIIQTGTTVDTAINLANATINTNAITSPGFSLGPTGNISAAAATFTSTIKLASYTIAGLPTCNAASLGSIAVVSNGTAYATNTYGSAVSSTGAVTRKVLCTNTEGATTYAWAYN